MTTIIQDGGIDRYDDLHIDHIEKEWADRKYWLNGAIQAFQIASNQRDRLDVGLVVAVGFSLTGSEEPIGPNFTSSEEFEMQLDSSPPSLYLFYRGQEPWKEKQSASSLENLLQPTVITLHNVFAEIASRQQCYYLEFFRPDEAEYRRSVFITE
jgi:hypothetical protein